ncbi:MAG: hypothetical protein LBP29_01450 [Treponema sp.]|jgi:hypothetical protein|nr:hypothetical protein [Treponema sp.]
MKRLSAALVFGFLIVSFCFAQEIQIGNASYNSSKGGFTISHSSLSFNTRVKVTNLRNSRFVKAVVNGRIPISAERIVDISREAGDALGIDKNGMTLVQIETLPAGVEAPPAASPAQTAVPAPAPPQSAPPSVITQTQVLPLQTVTEYVQVPAAVPCCNARLILAIFLLLILVIAILVVILVLLLRRLPPWPWHYPLWLRRRYRRVKKFRKRLLPWLY